MKRQVRTVRRTNLVQAWKFSELLDEAINRYTNRSLTTAEIIADLVKLAKQVCDDQRRHEELGLREDEVAFQGLRSRTRRGDRPLLPVPDTCDRPRIGHAVRDQVDHGRGVSR